MSSSINSYNVLIGEEYRAHDPVPTPVVTVEESSRTSSSPSCEPPPSCEYGGSQEGDWWGSPQYLNILEYT